MTTIRTLIHNVEGDFLHARDLITHLLEERDQAEKSGDKAGASAIDRVIVNIATPLMLRDKHVPETPAAEETLHTEPEQGDANA